MTQNSTSNSNDGRKNSDPSPVPERAADDAEYRVGPGRPPKEHQFKPGQSGNPKGAKRKAPSLAPDLKKLLEQVLDRKITITQGEKKRTLTLFTAGIEQLVKQFVKGDRHARNELFALADKVGLDLLGNPEEGTRASAHGEPTGDALRLRREAIRPRRATAAGAGSSGAVGRRH